MAVVKSNAYGHGIETISKVLEECGVDSLAVGDLDEALILRKNNMIRVSKDTN